jgi:hypothetical protein
MLRTVPVVLAARQLFLFSSLLLSPLATHDGMEYSTEQDTLSPYEESLSKEISRKCGVWNRSKSRKAGGKNKATMTTLERPSSSLLCIFKEGDLVWVRRGSSKSPHHEEPAIVVACGNNEEEEGEVTVKYTTAGYTEAVESSRVRRMEDVRRNRVVAVVTPPATTVAAAAAASNSEVEEDDTHDDDEPISRFATTTNTTPTAAVAAKSNSNKRKRVSIDSTKEEDNDDDDEMIEVVSQSGSDGAGTSFSTISNGIGFFVEYSKTSRATCRRCDLPINKGQMRVGHKPLFRGQQGFVVYRHLHCAVFPPNLLEGYQLEGYDSMIIEDQKLIDQRLNESAKEVQEENEEIQPDELLVPTFQGEKRSAPPGLSADLLPFQVDGQSWMYAQEQTPYRGGILADEMGLGKTIQTIATILDHRPLLQHCTVSHPKCSPDATDSYREAVTVEQEKWDTSVRDWTQEMKMQNVPTKILPKKKPTRAGTLVVCPVIALTQWKTEIEKFCQPNTLSVVTYHGPDRSSQTPKSLLAKYDVVLTTYQVLEADFRKMISPNKVKCPNCGKGFKVTNQYIMIQHPNSLIMYLHLTLSFLSLFPFISLPS